ncbi:hypothetical protein GCM10009680_61840 [Streptomyces yatensis]|uniref:Tyr recombinase domain-containing protein n=1 Tax=Streptomyces yatensis TaxID=155177 RepID=A0ABN2IV60_9ACTN
MAETIAEGHRAVEAEERLRHAARAAIADELKADSDLPYAAVDRLHTLYELALPTGLRKGELLGLHWEDLDLNGGTATIHRSLQRTRSGGLTVLNTKTLASERRIALPTECINSLKIHQERQQEDRQAAGTGWMGNRLVFTTPKGRPLDPTNVTRRFHRLLHKAGIRTIRFHEQLQI